MEQAILDFIYRVYQTLGWLGVVALMTIESACIPLPSEIIMPLAGWMLVESAGLSVWWILMAAFCGALGNVFGSLIAYVVGVKGGVPFLRRYGKYILITDHDLDRANYWFDKRGDWITFIARFVPGVRTFISLPAGIARMNIPKFTFFAFVGSFIWSGGLAYAGYVLGQNWEKIRAVMRPFDYPIVGIVIALVIFFVWWRLRSRRKAPNTHSP
jgi:membrane protein DedA with SNARE-associated domain